MTSYQRVQELYLCRDQTGLFRAYQNGSNYIQRLALRYLTEIADKKTCLRLLAVLQQERPLDKALYQAILQIVARLHLVLPAADRNYLLLKRYLITKDIAPVRIPYRSDFQPSSPPIAFEKPSRKLLKKLADMKWQFESY